MSFFLKKGDDEEGERRREGERERGMEGEREGGRRERETDRQTDDAQQSCIRGEGEGGGGGVNVFQRTSRVERVKIEKKGDADHFMAS